MPVGSAARDKRRSTRWSARASSRINGLGETAPAAMRELYAATVELPKIPTAIEGIGTAAVGTSVKVEKLAAVFPKFTTGSIADLNKIGEGFKEVDLTVEAATIDRRQTDRHLRGD